MRYIYASFKGYIGFYNGLGLEKLEIDFTKCKNNIVLICGGNGVGKSTLLNSLNPFPDPSSSFVPNMDAMKQLTLFDNGDTYQIKIISPADTKGGRKTTKAFISKNGLELNENGNVSSFKEIIFSEFDLDSNYISLTKLSSNDRGLGDKTPSERKKFVANIISNLDIYNDIYKTLNKKSLIFKSQTNTTHTKIQNIGSKENLEMNLKHLQEQHLVISNRILMLNNKIVELETRSIINSEEVSNIQELERQKEKFETELSGIEIELKLIQRTTKIDPESIREQLESDSKLLATYNLQLEEAKHDWISHSEHLSSISNSINELKINIEMYSGDINYSVEERYKASKQKIQSLETSICNLGVVPNIDYIYKLSNLIDFYNVFIKKLDNFTDGLTSEDLKEISINYHPDKVLMLRKELEQILIDIGVKQSLISETGDKIKKISVLENRPNNCKIDSCPFIAEAVQISLEVSSTEELVDRLSSLQEELFDLSKKSTEYTNLIEKYSFYMKKRMELDEIIRDLRQNVEIISIFDKESKLLNIDEFLLAISNSYYFNNQRDPRRLIDLLNYLKELESETKVFSILNIEYESMKSKLSLLDRTQASLSRLESELIETSNKVEEAKSKRDSIAKLCNALTEKIANETKYISILQSYRESKSKLSNIISSIKEIENKSSESIQNALQINEIKLEIDKLNRELSPINADISRISGQLTLLASYYEEYKTYKVKYDTIETLKKYCSPTAGGIQTLFMQLYMSKTLELANQVLGMLFEGEYKLLDFVINQNEFKIPFIGSGLPVDDISSGSNSQICIMGMAINLVLFYQASTKFNIARLDEVDSGLDHRNRFKFVNALYRCTQLLNIEQLFTISHSMEADTSAVDIIKLKYDSEQVIMGNVIYDYYSDNNH